MKAQRQLIRRRKFVAVDALARAGSAVATWCLVAGVLSAFFIAGCDSSTDGKEDDMPDQDESTQSPASRAFYEGYEQDILLLRKTTRLSRPVLDASSGEAIEAAERVFANIDLVGMTKQEVLELLGDPATISDYGVPAGPGLDQPLVYRFDNGRGGVQFTMIFEGEVSVSIQKLGID